MSYPVPPNRLDAYLRRVRGELALVRIDCRGLHVHAWDGARWVCDRCGEVLSR